MDWNKIKEKAMLLKDKTVEYSTKASLVAGKGLEKSKEYTSKAVELSKDSISKTPISLKILADYEKIKNDKYLAILFLTKDNSESKKILLKMPIILSKAWINNYTIRTCFIDDSNELKDHFGILEVPSLYIFKEGQIQKELKTSSEIDEFLKNFII